MPVREPESRAANLNLNLNSVIQVELSRRPDRRRLGVRLAMTDDFSEEKAYVIEEMKQRLSALRLDRMLSPTLKELAIKIGVIPVFRFSAGVVPWTKTELEQISQMWLAAFKQAWTFSQKLDGSPISLDQNDVRDRRMGASCPRPLGTVHMPPWRDLTDCHPSPGADVPCPWVLHPEPAAMFTAPWRRTQCSLSGGTAAALPG